MLTPEEFRKKLAESLGTHGTETNDVTLQLTVEMGKGYPKSYDTRIRNLNSSELMAVLRCLDNISGPGRVEKL